MNHENEYETGLEHLSMDELIAIDEEHERNLGKVGRPFGTPDPVCIGHEPFPCDGCFIDVRCLSTKPSKWECQAFRNYQNSPSGSWKTSNRGRWMRETTD